MADPYALSLADRITADLAQGVPDRRTAQAGRSWISDFFIGGPAPMQPDLLQTQMGAVPESGQTRRPGVLPLTRDADTGWLQLAMPKLLDIAGSQTGGLVAPVKGAGVVLGSGPTRTASQFADLIAQSRDRAALARSLTEQALAAPKPRMVLEKEGKTVVLTPSLDPAYRYRVTSFDESGPLGHREYGDDATASIASEISQHLASGYRPRPRRLSDPDA